jgi:hypothetical protein
MPAPDYAVEIAALEDAAASGELRVQTNGDIVIYRKMEELLRSLDYYKAKATAALPACQSPSNVTVAAFSHD